MLTLNVKLLRLLLISLSNIIGFRRVIQLSPLTSLMVIGCLRFSMFRLLRLGIGSKTRLLRRPLNELTALLILLVISGAGTGSNALAAPGEFIYYAAYGTSVARNCDNEVCGSGNPTYQGAIEDVVDGHGQTFYQVKDTVTASIAWYDIWIGHWVEGAGGCYSLVLDIYQDGACAGASGLTTSTTTYDLEGGLFYYRYEAEQAILLKQSTMFCEPSDIDSIFGAGTAFRMLQEQFPLVNWNGGFQNVPPGMLECSTANGSVMVYPADGCSGDAKSCGEGSPFTQLMINDYVLCACVPCPVQQCGTGRVWDQSSCSCVELPCPPVDCEAGEVWSQDQCDCIPDPEEPPPGDDGGNGPVDPPPPPPPPPNPDDPWNPPPPPPDPDNPIPPPDDPLGPKPRPRPGPGKKPGRQPGDGPLDGPVCLNCPTCVEATSGTVSLDANGDEQLPCQTGTTWDPVTCQCVGDNEIPPTVDPAGKIIPCAGGVAIAPGSTFSFYKPEPVWSVELNAFEYIFSTIDITIPNAQDISKLGIHRQGAYLDPGLVDWDALEQWSLNAKKMDFNLRGMPDNFGGANMKFNLANVDGVPERPHVVLGQAIGQMREAISRETQRVEDRGYRFPSECGMVVYPIKNGGGGLLFGEVANKLAPISGFPMPAESGAAMLSETFNSVIAQVAADAETSSGIGEMRAAVNGFSQAWINGYRGASASGSNDFWVISVPILNETVSVDLRKGIPGAPQFVLADQSVFIRWVRWISGVSTYLWGVSRIMSFWRSNSEGFYEAVGKGSAQARSEGSAALDKYLGPEMNDNNDWHR